MEIWDGYYKDGSLAGVDLIRDEEIPQGLYHLVCDVLVKHVDGDYLLMQRDFSKNAFPGRYETTAGGSALKGENELQCVKRELFEETGIISEQFKQIGHFVYDDRQCIFYIYLCVTDWDKEEIKLQEGETISYKWLNEKEFSEFINSDEMIDVQKERYMAYFKGSGLIGD